MANHARTTENGRDGQIVTSLSVGLGVDPVTQEVQGASERFKVGTTMMLVVTMVGWNGSAQARLLLGSTLEATQQWQMSDGFSTPAAPHSSFTASATLDEVGRYRWEVDLTSFAGGSQPFLAGSITFQVT